MLVSSLVLALSVVRWLHIVAGALALSVFWVPLVARKGGTIHRRAGWVYVGAMAVVGVTGVLVCAARLGDADPTNDAGALFLLYVALLAATTSWMGVRVLRTKARTEPHGVILDLAFPATLGLGAVALAAMGIRHGQVVFVVFAGLGGAIAFGQIRFWRRAPVTRREWFFQHMGGMGASCIATVTAFVVVNAQHLGLEGLSFVPWVAPGVIGGVGLTVWERYYRGRLARPRDASRAEGGVVPSTR